MPTPNQPTGGSPEQYDPYIANYGRKWSQMDPLTKRRLIEMAPSGGAGTGLSSRRIQEMVHHDVVPPWVGTGPMNTGYKRSGSQALEELKKIREYAHPELFQESVQPFISPTPSPALADLAGSAALSSSSLDPFLFSPTSTPVSTSSALGDVLVPYNPDLGTVPIGDQAPVTVSSGTDPNIFSAQVEEPTTFSQGGAAMPGLGFRPLHYQDAGAVHSVERAEEVIQTFGPSRGWGEKTIIHMMLHGTPEQKIAEANKILKSPPVYDESFIEEGASISPEDGQQAREERTVPSDYVLRGRYELPRNPETGLPWTAEERGPMVRTPKPGGVNPETGESYPGMGYTTGDKAGSYGSTMEYVPGRDPTEFTTKLLGEPVTDYQAGGPVGRGTMAGELGRRGDLSVRQAGETMQERWKRMHGYANGGYTSRGTVAGELAPKGSLPVRVAGESMGELAKRHRDQDWYNRMGRGLGSLRRRMA